MRWNAYDFKGLRHGELELEPGVLTVLAGANSSGKSSLLQSVLMVAQSLHHDGPIVLNGPLARLGEATDLVRDGTTSTRIAIRARGERGRWDDNSSSSGDGAPELRVEYELRSVGDGGSLALHKVILNQGHLDSTPLVLSRENARSSDVSEVAQIVGHSDASILHVKSTLGTQERQLRTYVAFVGLMPIALIKLETSERILSEYQHQLAAATKRLKRAVAETRKSVRFESFSQDLLLIDRELARVTNQRALSGEADPATRELFESVGPARSSTERAANLLRLEEPAQQRVISALAALRAGSDYVHIPVQRTPGRRTGTYFGSDQGLLERSLSTRLRASLLALSGLGSTLEDLARQVQYLGPLRDEPRVVWTQWNEQATGLPVGSRGEYSAAVLARRANRKISYVTTDRQSAHAPLNDAVNDWLSYLEIGESVAARSRGKLGVGVEVKMGGRPRDLTSVGVGVSQALPLIVALLTVPLGSIFLVEQPELHLHPAVQARLADFLVTARPDLAVVVETHSEAFLTRIRRRVAEEKVQADRVRIVFMENGGSGAETRSLALSEYGDLSEWPSGFISGDDDDTRAILQANLNRVRNANDAGRG